MSEPASETLSKAALPDELAHLPVCVDLDDTLISTDMLYESLLLLLKYNPFCLFLLPLWLMKGKAYLKNEIASRVTVQPQYLPYRKNVLAWLNQLYQAGHRLVLVTATDQRIADSIAQYLGIFSRVHGSTAAINLKGANKADFLQAQYPDGFIYAGDHQADLQVWQVAKGAVVVSDKAHLAQQVSEVTRLIQTFTPQRNLLRSLIKALRPHQWVKNVLIFVPLVASHSIFDAVMLINALIALMSFSLAASSAYVLNDMLDLEADRQHRSKCKRPFASGALPLQYGFLLMPVSLLLSVLLAVLFLPAASMLVLMIYYALTLAYSFILKRKILLDVMCLAVLYTMRVIAGAVATSGFDLSHWLLAFSTFLFLCLAFVKRYSELHALRLQNRQTTAGRGYTADDLEILGNMGVSSGYLSVLVMALYINSAEVRMLYNSPDVLWLVCLLMLYWISRVWLITHRGMMHDDPIVFAIRDRVSHLCAVLMGVIIWMAI